jgi:GxxExxY protein
MQPCLAEVLYKRALVIELDSIGIGCQLEKKYSVYYNKQFIGRYYADIVVANSIIVEVKAVKALDSAMRSQLINYLRISGIRVGYLCNFSSNMLEFKRFIR